MLRQARLKGIALAGGLCAAASAHASDALVIFEHKTAVHDKTLVVTAATPTEIVGDVILELTAIGDINDADEKIKLTIDGTPFGAIVTGAGVTERCTPIKQTLKIPNSTAAAFFADGQISLSFQTFNISAADDCDYKGLNDISVAIDGELRYTSANSHRKETLEDAVAVAHSISASRRSVTLSNLPTLSNRLASVGRSFSGGLPSGGLPGGGLPGGSLPGGATSSGGLPGGGLPGGHASFARGASLTGAGDAANGRLSFSGDFSSMRAAAAAHLSGGEPQAAAIGANGGAQPIDFWFGGSYTYFDSAAGGVSQQGDIATVQMGVDSRLSEDLLIGVAAFGDLLVSKLSDGADTRALGFMTGPYFVASLNGPLYLEALAAAGRAYNTISPDGDPDTEYASDRLLLTARLSGDWRYQAWAFRPSTRLTYYAEKQRAFTDGAGSTAPEQTTILGQLRFGPEIGYDISLDDVALADAALGDAELRPFLGAEGVWAFRQTDQLVDGVAVAAEDLSASLSFGLDGRIGRTTFRAGGRYDGIGDRNLDSVTGELTVRIPLD